MSNDASTTDGTAGHKTSTRSLVETFSSSSESMTAMQNWIGTTPEGSRAGCRNARQTPSFAVLMHALRAKELALCLKNAFQKITVALPEQVEPSNAYRAMRAVLRAAHAASASFSHVFCPGLTTGVGGVDPAEAAEQMARAYGDFSCAQH